MNIVMNTLYFFLSNPILILSYSYVPIGTSCLMYLNVNPSPHAYEWIVNRLYHRQPLPETNELYKSGRKK